jgi:hypothetical protein
MVKKNKLMAPTILERGLPMSKSFEAWFIFYKWIENTMLNLLKRTMTYLGFEPGTFGLAVSFANHYTI